VPLKLDFSENLLEVRLADVARVTLDVMLAFDAHVEWTNQDDEDNKQDLK